MKTALKSLLQIRLSRVWEYALHLQAVNRYRMRWDSGLEVRRYQKRPDLSLQAFSRRGAMGEDLKEK